MIRGQIHRLCRAGVICPLIYANNEAKHMLACGLAVAKRQWRLFSNDRNGV